MHACNYFSINLRMVERVERREEEKWRGSALHIANEIECENRTLLVCVVRLLK